MDGNMVKNAGVMSLGAFFVGVVPTLYTTNFWYAVVAAVVGVACFVLYDYLPV